LIIDGYLLNSFDVDTLCDANKFFLKNQQNPPHWSKKFTMGLKFSGPLELSVK
jgi:hypothetical protein